jgi:hypothetical protein
MNDRGLAGQLTTAQLHALAAAQAPDGTEDCHRAMPQVGWICTLPKGHSGYHFAGLGYGSIHVCAVWENESDFFGLLKERGCHEQD